MASAFRHFGGVPSEISFNNLKTVFDHSKSSFASTVFNQKFEYFAKEMGFKPIACRPYRPQTKGKVESIAKLMDRLKAYIGEFNTLTDLENISRNFKDDINHEQSQGSGKIPYDEFKKKESIFSNSLTPVLLISMSPTKKNKKTYPVSKNR